MGKLRVIMVLLAIAGLTFVAVGGVSTLPGSGLSPLEKALEPLLHGSLADVAIAMLGVILLVWALLPSGEENGVSRASLLKGVALGSALVVAVCCALVLHLWRGSDATLAGILGTVAVLQGTVGLLASLLLLARRESRRGSLIPLALNGGLAALVLTLTHGSLYF
ncbi:MAG: hypothetical protein ACE5GW_10660 [Planctomycetota bacterium]